MSAYDAEKRNATVMAGCLVLHFTPRHIKSGIAVRTIEVLLKTKLASLGPWQGGLYPVGISAPGLPVVSCRCCLSPKGTSVLSAVSLLSGVFGLISKKQITYDNSTQQNAN